MFEPDCLSGHCDPKIKKRGEKHNFSLSCSMIDYLQFGDKVTLL